jgi:hypothetical protein
MFEVVFYLQNYLSSSSIYKNILGHLPFTIIFEVVFQLQTYLMSSSNFQKIFEVIFHFQKYFGLSFTKRQIKFIKQFT